MTTSKNRLSIPRVLIVFLSGTIIFFVSSSYFHLSDAIQFMQEEFKLSAHTEQGVSSIENLLPNGGFEESTNDIEPTSWRIVGDVNQDGATVHSGSQSIRVQADQSTSGVISELIKAEAHSLIQISGYMKAENVVSPGSYHRLRVTLSAFEADQKTRIRHWDLVSTVGSFDWQKIQGDIILPNNTEYVRLALALTECTGTFWADDFTLHVAHAAPSPMAEDGSNAATAKPVVPNPWQMQPVEQGLAEPVDHADSFNIGRVAIVTELEEPRLKRALHSYFTETKISFVESGPDTIDTDVDTVIQISDKGDLPTYLRQAVAMPSLLWSDLGNEGYFMSTKKGDGKEEKNYIYISANSEQGRFYALQTLKQIIPSADKTVPQITIADRPTIALRGTPIGRHWYSEQEKIIQRLASLKFNFVWNQGTFENQFLWHRWREPLPETEAQRIREYLQLAEQNFITPYIAIGPRGDTPENATTYSSNEEIDLAVAKMSQLYELGVRHFGIAFDDLGNHGQNVLFGDDIEYFENDIGEAHAYFVKQIYSRLSARYGDIHLVIVPMVYQGIGQVSDVDEAYLRSLGELPLEIGMYSSAVYPEDAKAAYALTGRKHLVWDNYWASFYSSNHPSPDDVVALERMLEADDIAGYSFMPIHPQYEDSKLTSWHSAASFAWSPARYRSNRKN